MAYYLTYRPQTIADLDLASLRETLYGYLRSETVPHAMLFTGIRGTGKTSSARILAKAVNCTKNKRTSAKKDADVEPCNQCDACKSITIGSSMDVIEIDAASHRGIDDIRELREKVKLAPTQLEYKVYIIDEVHMLTTEAFNALLKTLEEPPRKVIFILATTELHKLPDTIVSRCALVELRNATDTELTKALDRVVKGEKLKIDKDALALIAQMGQGSFRDATKYLEEVSWMKPPITRETVEDHFHLKATERDQLIQLLAAGDSKPILELIETVADKGTDIQQFSNQLIEQLHQLLLTSLTQNKQPANWSADQTKRIPQLIRLIDQYTNLYSHTQISQLPLQLAIVEWLNPHAVSSSVQTTVTPEPATAPSPRSTPRPTPQSRPSAAAVQPIRSQPAPPPPPKLQFDGEITPQIWEQVMESVKQRNFSVAGLLRSTKPQGISENAVVLEVFYSFHKDKLEDEKTRHLIETTISQITGQNLKLSCILSDQNASSSVANSKSSTIGDQNRNTITADKIPTPQPMPTIDTTPTPQADAPKQKKVASAAPVATEEDEELVKFAEELFTNGES